ncbi:MAG: hypothetical protein ACOX6M_12745 [Armatimonadota bacterium]
MTEMGERVAKVEKDIENLKGWQKTQNGHLEKIDEKLDRFQWWLVLALGGIAANLAVVILK